eukprot:GAHX01000988.1.p1 GENE.GAHX01000988.1~~GAHX01000988.1.p1  ORF type:complete len:603 (-),score=114.30 GAHX01000988.1:68-1831(-)
MITNSPTMQNYAYELFKISSNTHNGVYKYITIQNSKIINCDNPIQRNELVNETKMTLFMANKKVQLPCSESLLILKESSELHASLQEICVDFGISKIAELTVEEVHENVLPISYSLQFIRKRVLFDYVLSICMQSYHVLNAFYWNLSYLKHQLGQPYNIYESLFEAKLQESIQGQIYRRRLRKAETLLMHFKTVGEAAKSAPGKSQEKEKVVESLIETLKIQTEVKGIYFPINTEFKIGKNCEFKVSVLKSAMFPILYKFNNLERMSIYDMQFNKQPTISLQKLSTNKNLEFIFKTGDSVHKDHLVMFLFGKMQKILNRAGLQTKNQFYNITPVFRDSGLVEFVPNCINLAQLITEFKSLKSYFESVGTDINEARSNFTESIAFYTVACYILAIGDRHKDNILIKKDGTAFHIDFSYILGADPKPYAPLVKVTEEMVEFIDEKLVSAYVTEEELYYDGKDIFGSTVSGSKDMPFIFFLRRCVVFYNALRKNSSDILNLISVTKNAYVDEKGLNINRNECKLDNLEIKSSPVFNDKRNFAYDIVLNRLKVDMNDTEAGKHICSVVVKSIHAFMPKVMDKFHDWAQSWR